MELSCREQKPGKVEARLIPTRLGGRAPSFLSTWRGCISSAYMWPSTAMCLRLEDFGTVWHREISLVHSLNQSVGAKHDLDSRERSYSCHLSQGGIGTWDSLSRWQRLYFLPDPHQHGLFLPSFRLFIVGRHFRVKERAYNLLVALLYFFGTCISIPVTLVQLFPVIRFTLIAMVFCSCLSGIHVDTNAYVDVWKTKSNQAIASLIS